MSSAAALANMFVRFLVKGVFCLNVSNLRAKSALKHERTLGTGRAEAFHRYSQTSSPDHCDGDAWKESLWQAPQQARPAHQQRGKLGLIL